MSRKSKRAIIFQGHEEHSQSSINSKDERICNQRIHLKYQTAVYVRLSKEESNLEGSIENQKKMLVQYVEGKDELQLNTIFVDNGYTGTNFSRPAWNELMNEVNLGNINCIVVKDLSRFGRNYIETGQYLEFIFPALGTRFIAINDQYDSILYEEKLDYLTTPFQNIVNEAYSKDISYKIRSTFDTKKQHGAYITSIAPYGYIKIVKPIVVSTDDMCENPIKKIEKNKDRIIQLVIDEYAASIVRDIFEQRALFKRFVDIARELNDREIPSPNNYKYQKGILKDSKNKSIKWGGKSIKDITNNPVYLGFTVYNKTKKNFSNKAIRVHKEEWLVKKGTHQAIISEELYKEVERINDVKKRGSFIE